MKFSHKYKRSTWFAGAALLGAAGAILWVGLIRQHQPLPSPERGTPFGSQKTDLARTVPGRQLATFVPPASQAQASPAAAAADSAARVKALTAQLKGTGTGTAGAVKPGLALQIELAQQRSEELLRLMESDPTQALVASFSFAEYAALPAEVQKWVERPFSLRGDLQMYPVCAYGVEQPDGPKGVERGSIWIQPEGTTQAWSAFLKGSRAEIGSKDGIALQGIELQGKAVIRNEVMQVLDSASAAAARDTFGMKIANADPARDFLTGNPIVGQPVTAAAGGRLFLFSEASGVEILNAELARMEQKPGPKTGSQVLLQAALLDPTVAGNGFNLEKAWMDVDLAASTWTETPKRVYVLRVDFPNLTGEPVSQAAITSTFNTSVSNQIRAMSYAKTWVSAAASPMVVRLPNGTSSYLPSNNNLIRDEAKAAFNALGTGVNLADYDIVCVAFKPFGLGQGGSVYAGLAGGGDMWLQGAFGQYVITHELGHTYGLGHAAFWATTNGSVLGAGTSEEYGDVFDIMGLGPTPQGHYNMQAKSRLNWLDTSQWTAVSASGTYRVYRLDDPATSPVRSRALRLTKVASPAEYYWAGYRRAFQNQRYLDNGIYLLWQQAGFLVSHLLDTTPGSAGGKDDAAVLIGRTYSDNVANIHLTPVGNGGTGPDEWLDITVKLGPFVGNRPPAISLNGPTTVAARSLATYSATGSDPDGDALAYDWDFGDGSPAFSNVPSVSHTWAGGGTYAMRVAVSDMKGLVVTQSLTITVQDPLIQWVSGSISPAENLGGVTYSRGRFVAAGGSHAFQSYDGITWENSLIEDDLNAVSEAVAEGGGRFVSVGWTYDSVLGWHGSIHSSPDGRIWTRATLPIGDGLNDVTYGNGVWVTVGNTGTAFRSIDAGTTWSRVNVSATPPSSTQTIAAVTFGNGTFVAAGSTNVFTSTDGQNWVSRSGGISLNSRPIYYLAFWNGRFFACGFYTGIQQSSDNGQTWQPATLPPYSYNLEKLSEGDGFLLAVGNRQVSPYPQVHLISTDGNSWYEQNIPTPPALASLAWGAGRAVGVGGAGQTYRTSNFYPANHAPTISISGPAAVSARSEVSFLALGSDPDSDPLTFIWDFGPGLPLQEGPSVTQNWPVGGTYAVRLTATDGRGGVKSVTNTVVVTDPLTQWTQLTSGTAASLNDICLGTNGAGLPILLAVGAGAGTIAYSTNGSNWSTVSLNQANVTLFSATYSGRQFIACGRDYSFGTTNDWVGAIWTSSSGTNWTRRFTGGSNTVLTAVTSAGQTVVAVGEVGLILYSINGGTNWTPATTTATRNFSGVAWGGGRFVAVGGAPDGSTVQVFTSNNGTQWSDASTGAGVAGWQNFGKIEYCKDRFLASGWYSKIRHSTDGGVSFQTTRARTEETPAFAFGNGIFFAAGWDRDNTNADINLISIDGENWSPVPTLAQNDRRATIFFGNRFLTVGDGGAIWQSGLVTPPALLLRLAKPSVAGNQVRLDFSLVSGSPGTFTLQRVGALPGSWSDDTSAVLTTNVPDSSYRFMTTTNGATRRFYRVRTQ